MSLVPVNQPYLNFLLYPNLFICDLLFLKIHLTLDHLTCQSAVLFGLCKILWCVTPIKIGLMSGRTLPHDIDSSSVACLILEKIELYNVK